MKTVAITQNTEEWLKLRNNYLGASESNIIMGVSKFRTPLELWKLKTGEAKPENKEPNFIQQKGHDLEERFRNLVELMYDTEFPSLVVTSEEYDFLMCSLDGYSEELNATWECKYCGEDDFNFVRDKEEVLPQYKPQVQHQLMITGAKRGYFTVITEEKDEDGKQIKGEFKNYTIEVEPDLEYMKNELLPALVSFWECVKTKTSPGVSDQDTIDLSDDENLIELLASYKMNQEDLASKTKRDKELKAKIFKICKAKKTTCNGVKITKSKSADKEVPDYQAAAEAHGIDFKAEGYMKIQKGRETKRITFPNEGNS